MRYLLWFLAVIFVLLLVSKVPAQATPIDIEQTKTLSAPESSSDRQSELSEQNQIYEERITDLENRLSEIEGPQDDMRRNAVDAGALAMLFGAFCALWAQNTKRNALLWFFLGAFFNVITVLALLVRNANDVEQQHEMKS